MPQQTTVRSVFDGGFLGQWAKQEDHVVCVRSCWNALPWGPPALSGTAPGLASPRATSPLILLDPPCHPNYHRPNVYTEASWEGWDKQEYHVNSAGPGAHLFWKLPARSGTAPERPSLAVTSALNLLSPLYST